MKKILAILALGLLWGGNTFSEVVSKNPNYLKRGKIDKVHIANYKKRIT